MKLFNCRSRYLKYICYENCLLQWSWLGDGNSIKVNIDFLIILLMISYLNTLKYLLDKNNWELILGLNSNECYMKNVYFLDNFSNKDREDSG